ncbi:MAG: hypothetical protein IKZ87_06145 [Actinomycetaceae bacterium]|nr:hypothetical protein [Actinomycetaceae bacterium]
MGNEMVSKYEYDSSPELWEYYARLYEYEFEPHKDDGRRITKTATINGQTMEMAGDCFFNFNEKKSKKFKKIRGVKDEPSLVSELDKLKEKWHHSKENCILLPVTGGLNNVKGMAYLKGEEIYVCGSGGCGSKPYDRPDTFLCLVNDFYEKKDSIHALKQAGEFLAQSIFKHSLSSENFAPLYDFMVSFADVYDFARHFLGIGDDVKEIVDEMLQNGKKDIKTADDVKNYIDLARKFWGAREKEERFNGSND